MVDFSTSTLNVRRFGVASVSLPIALVLVVVIVLDSIRYQANNLALQESKRSKHPEGGFIQSEKSSTTTRTRTITI
jgi:hypothetical protein